LANCGVAELTRIVPAMLSPPTLTGVMPENSVTLPTQGRVDVGQRRVHVVGAGGDQVHAIDLDPDAVIGQAVNGWQAGDATGAVDG
jgi:hypothetical protein